MENGRIGGVRNVTILLKQKPTLNHVHHPLRVMAEPNQLLEKTSRTFALCIPLLPKPSRREVTLAYLLFRIADTFEDAAVWSRERRISALNKFGNLLETGSIPDAERMANEWLEYAPTKHLGYRQLLAESPAVLDDLSRVRTEARDIISHHVRRTAIQMAAFVARADDSGTLVLRDLPGLRDYCYAVAGIVGEMLTELFILQCPALVKVQKDLMKWAPAFGEGLQLTNILKDAEADRAEGRCFLPEAVETDDIFAVARMDLDAAADYTLTLQRNGASSGVVAFNALPLRLARATLHRVQAKGPGAKLSRPEVFKILSEVKKAVRLHRPVCASEKRLESTHVPIA